MLSKDDKEACAKLLKKLTDNPQSEPFREPVNWKELGLTDYPSLIKVPMDLGTATKKLAANKYADLDSYAADVRLIFKNCMAYNTEGSEVYKMAVRLEKIFDREYAKMTGKTKAGGPRPVSDDEKDRLCKLLYTLDAAALGKVVSLVDELSPSSVEHSDVDELDINLDLVDPVSFRKIEALAKELFAAAEADDSGSKGRSKSAGTGTSAASSSALPGSENGDTGADAGFKRVRTE